MSKKKGLPPQATLDQFVFQDLNLNMTFSFAPFLEVSHASRPAHSQEPDFGFAFDTCVQMSQTSPAS